MARVELEFLGKDAGATVTISKITDATGELDKALLRMVQAEKSAAAQKDLETKFEKLSEVEKDAMLKINDFNEAQARAAEEQRKSAITADNYRDKLSGMLHELDAADPVTQGLAKSTQHLWEQFKRGELTAEQTRAGLKQIQGATEATKTSFGGLANGLNEISQELTGFNLAQLTVVGGLAALAGGIKKTVTEYSGYVEAVDKMAMATGMSAEETSKLIQVSDDFRVEQSAVEQAMKMALKNGFTPSIESLAQLSDKFLSIQDPAKRAEEMSKIFGKSWQDMVPLLVQGGDAIRGAADEMSGGLVVTEDAIIQNRLYMKSLDDLQDAWRGLTYGGGAGIVPILTDMMTALGKSGEALEKQRFSWLNLIPPLKYAVIAYQEITGASEERKQKTQELLNGIEKERAGQAALSAELEAAAAATPAYTNAQIAAGYAAQALAANLEQSRAKTEANQKAMAEYIKVNEELQKAQENLNAAQETFNQSFSDKVVQRLDNAGIKGEKYEEALGLVDRKLGTTHLAQLQANKSLDAAIKKFAETGNLNDFAAALDANKTKWAELDDNLIKAQDGFDKVKAKFDKFIEDLKSADGMTIKINIDAGGGGGSSDVGQGGKKCFVYETPVNTPEGYRPIGEIQPGDTVYTYTEAGELHSSLVTRNAGHNRADLVRVRTSDGQVFSCSPDHPWAVRSDCGGHQFVEAGKLKSADRLISCSGLAVFVLDVTPEPGTFEVFDLSVDHAEHTFLVGGLVVHNKEAEEFGAATGLDMIVPPGYPNDSYSLPLNVTSGERVTVIPAGQTSTSGGGDVYVNMTVYPSSAVDVEMIAQTVVSKINKARRFA